MNIYSPKLSIQIRFKYVVLIFFLSINTDLEAQDFDLIKIRSAYYPNQSIEESSVNGEIGFFEWGGQVSIPQPFKSKKTILIHKLSYGNLRVDTEASLMSGSIKNSKNYHTISYNLGIVHTLSPKWRLTINLNPTLASDLEASLNEDDFLYQVNSMVLRTKSKKLKYGFGLAFTTRFGRQLVIPIGMLKYSTQKMNLDILAPNMISVLFKSKKQTFLYGLETGLNGGLFNNTSNVETINTLIDEAGYSRLNIGPAISIILKNSIKIHFTGGVTAGRRLEFIDFDKEIIDRTPEVGPFFRIGLSFSPKKKTQEESSGNKT